MDYNNSNDYQNPKFVEQKKKIDKKLIKKISIIAGIVFGVLLIFLLIYILVIKDSNNSEINTIEDENIINLDTYSSDILISEAGFYILTGTTTHSVIITASGEVSLILDNAKIRTDNTAAIIGQNQSMLYIYTANDSVNTITDGGSSSYNAAIYSNSELVIDGIGVLTINGNQTNGNGISIMNGDLTIKEGTLMVNSANDGLYLNDNVGVLTIKGGTIYIDAEENGIEVSNSMLISGGKTVSIGNDNGIITGSGYEIDGGIFISLGTEMLEKPQSSSTQASLCFDLTDYISANTIVSLTDTDLNEVLSFESIRKFNSIVISVQTIGDGVYNLYEEGTHTGTLINGIYYNGSYTPGTLLATIVADDVVNIY